MSSLIPYRFNRHPMARAEFPMWDELFRPFYSSGEALPSAMRVDVKDEGDHYLLEADLPGFAKEDVNVEIEDGVLTISAEKRQEKSSDEKANYLYNERRFMKFQRSFSLNGIDESAVSGTSENGVLKLTLPKQVEQPKTGRKIDIG